MSRSRSPRSRQTPDEPIPVEGYFGLKLLLALGVVVLTPLLAIAFVTKLLIHAARA